MADTARLETALRNAHAAGDVAAATKLAQALKATRVDFSQADRGPEDRPELASALQGNIDRTRTADLASKSPKGPAGFGDRFTNAVTFGLSKDAGALAHALPGEVASWFNGQPFDFGKAYQEGRDIERARLDQYGQDHPIASTVADTLGTVGNIAATANPATLMAAGQTLGTAVKEGAKAGAAIGGLSGLGESDGGLVDRAAGAAAGATTGAAVGAALPVVVDAAGRGIQKYVVAPIRGMLNPEAEGARRIGMAQAADNQIPQPRLTPQDEAAALQRGQPILNVDRGGETTRALARSASNTSPQARAAMETAVGDRYASQGDRTIDTVRRIVGGGSTADNREALQTAARAANRPAYARAYGDPNAQAVWDDSLEQLAGAPIVQDAIRQAAVTGRNRGALDGFAPVRNPFQIDRQTGRLSLAVDAQGNRVLPSLQFWDHVKRNLDKVGTREAQQAARVLRDHLDTLVPNYATARAGAARFFGATDALEAGDAFVMSRMANDEARRAIGQMSQPERQLFAEGFADSLVRRVAEVGDRRNVIDSVFIRSRASRERIEMALGPQRARELEAFLRVEDLLNRARTALTGNSTTARQLVELGIAGGTGAYGLGTGDWSTSGGIIAGLLLRRGVGAIDRRVAQRVGEMLASQDASMVQRGLRMVAKSNRMFDILRRATAPAANAIANQGARALPLPQATP